MRDVFLSIIVPFYNPNVNLFKKCINSLHEIKIPHEIIIVDDGSSEDIFSECYQYVKDNDNAYFTRKRHSGVSAARNLGIVKSKGQYIFFLDADDEVSVELVDFLNSNYKCLNSDWILCGCKVRYHNSSRVKIRTIVSDESIKKDKKNIFNIDYNLILRTRIESKELSECWGKFINRKIVELNKIEFPLGVLSGEDTIFNTRLLQVIHSIQYIPINGYIYNYTPRLSDRLLVDPYKRYAFLSTREQELKRLINIRAPESMKILYCRKQKTMMILNLTQDCFILYKAGKLDNKMKNFLTTWMSDNQLFKDLRITDCDGLKLKVYYALMKYKMWCAIGVISKIKSRLKE